MFMKSLDALNPKCKMLAMQALQALTDAGVPHVVTSTLRTLQEQQAYFAQGREPLDVVNMKRKKAGMYLLTDGENSYVVTMCDGIDNKSLHQSGNAIDVVPANEAGNPIWPSEADDRWEVIATEFRKLGFTCGKDWNDGFRDCPHYQLDD
jgi:peptidoglycan LD-endopeptidase CwlK